MRGPDGVRVEVVSYVDKMLTPRDVYRLKRHGSWVGDYKSIEELRKHVDLAELVEDEPRDMNS
jgi:hypothetical protein